MSDLKPPISISNKTTGSQYKIMLKFMERHGDLCAPSGGGDGKLKTKLLWKELTSKLNAVTQHNPKTLQKWTKIWSDWKARTKKKALSSLEEENPDLILTDLECQLMGFLGWQVIVTEGNKDRCCISDKLEQENANNAAIGQDMSYEDFSYDSQTSSSPPDAVQEVVEHANARNISDPLSQNGELIKITDIHTETESFKTNKKSTPKRALSNSPKHTQSHERNKKLKGARKRALKSESRMEVIMEKYADIEAKRLEVELLKEKNEERRLAALEQSNDNQRQYMEFMCYMKETMHKFLSVYSAKNS